MKKDFRFLKVENGKTVNSLPHDYHNRYPSDPIYADMKSSATLEAIKKEPWRVYDIMGVGDSLARERVFEMIEEKYKIDYNDIYEAWMGHSWDKAVQKKSMEDAKRLAQKLGLKIGNESIDKQEWSMFNGLRKDAEKEIGNETYQHKLYPDKYVIIDGKNYKIITDGKVEKSGELTDAILYGINQTYKRVSSMNSKTGNKAIVLKDGNVWVVLYANETKSQEFETEAEARAFAKKVGNADTVSEYNAEIQRLTKKAEQLRRMGQGKSAMEIEKQIEKLGKELRELGNKKTGNAKVDWSKVTDKYIDKNGYEVVIQKKEDGYYITNLRNGKEIFAPDRYSAIGIMEKNGSRVENEETKAERKFGKVMGEFEEGALKTPQGKTVTDPAQAKAIAYSEADKVDNLKRARNAMNKKTGNKKYHVWTDSGNWDMVVSEEELENLKTTYKNFHYEEVK